MPDTLICPECSAEVRLIIDGQLVTETELLLLVKITQSIERPHLYVASPTKGDDHA